ncbi:MAG: hypothetical protein IT287_09580 [Bdellovibrionaceae bacterium]|nr:hypothetical protein [Pseudobdellovibrionaceae bacterium]
MILRAVVLFIIAISSSAHAALFSIKQHKELLATNANGEYEICWFGSATSETLPLRQDIQTYLLSQISDRIGIKLKFYNDCLKTPDPFFPIAIGFYDAVDNPQGITGELSLLTPKKNPGHPTTYSKGHWANIHLVDMVLTAHFKNVNEPLTAQVQPLTEVGKKNLLLSIALHEVLHAFGLAHEHIRPDSTCSVDDDTFKPSIHNMEGAYDPQSIMNYCQTHLHDFEASALPLSDGDISALKKFYFKAASPAGTL